MRSSGHRFVGICALLCSVVAGRAIGAAPGDLLGFLPFTTLAPQDIAYDTKDDVYWVTGFLSSLISRYSNDLKTCL